jgi:hypothetical protein
VKIDRQLFALVLVLAAVWWFFTLAKGCQVGRPRQAELIPASAPR